MSATTGATAIWHDVECGSYGADLGLWEELAAAASIVVAIGDCACWRSPRGSRAQRARRSATEQRGVRRQASGVRGGVRRGPWAVGRREKGEGRGEKGEG